MKTWWPIVWIGVAANLLIWSYFASEGVPIIPAAFAIGVATAQLVALRRSSKRSASSATDDSDVRELQQQVRVLEAEVSALTAELESVRSAHDFDRKLSRS